MKSIIDAGFYAIKGVSPSLLRQRRVIQKHFDDLPVFMENNPISSHSLRQFCQFRRKHLPSIANLVFDWGCGTGRSTTRLGKLFHNSIVFGVDKSEARLQRVPIVSGETDARVVRADMFDFWTLAALAGYRPTRQYLLHPNPWPKLEHFQRRVYGHPAFPLLFMLGGDITMRTNWRDAADEFVHACAQLQSRANARLPMPIVSIPIASSNPNEDVSELQKMLDEECGDGWQLKQYANTTGGVIAHLYTPNIFTWEPRTLHVGPVTLVDWEDGTTHPVLSNFDSKYASVGVPVYEVTTRSSSVIMETKC